MGRKRKVEVKVVKEVKRCAVPACYSYLRENEEYCELRYYRLPVHEPMRGHWLDFCAIETPFYCHKNERPLVCSDHFTPHDLQFYSTSKIALNFVSLKHDAVPSILPTLPSDIDDTDDPNDQDSNHDFQSNAANPIIINEADISTGINDTSSNFNMDIVNNSKQQVDTTPFAIIKYPKDPNNPEKSEQVVKMVPLKVKSLEPVNPQLSKKTSHTLKSKANATSSSVLKIDSSPTNCPNDCPVRNMETVNMHFYVAELQKDLKSVKKEHDALKEKINKKKSIMERRLQENPSTIVFEKLKEIFSSAEVQQYATEMKCSNQKDVEIDASSESSLPFKTSSKLRKFLTNGSQICKHWPKIRRVQKNQKNKIRKNLEE